MKSEPIPATKLEQFTAFCKVFSTDGHGQLLVKLDRSNEGNPEVRFYCQPQGLGVCSLATSYLDDDDGWDKAEEWFARVGLEDAIKATSIIWKSTEEFVDAESK